jgi:hypothetical protein
MIHAVADDRGVVVNHSAPQPHDLFAELLARREDIGRDIGA